VAGLLVGACVLAVAGWLGYGALRSHLLRELRAEMAGKDQATGPAPSPAALVPATAPSPPPPVSPAPPPDRDWSAVERGTFAVLSAADREQALAVARRLAERGEVTDEDVVRAETLQRRYPAEEALRQLVGAVLTRSAEQKRSRGDFAGARALLERAASLFPADRNVRRSQLVLLVEMRDWPAAEGAARAALAADPRDPDARRALALALAARGQDREALRAIYSALEVVTNAVDEPQLRSLRDQIERRLWATSGCEDSQLPDPARTGEAGQRLEKFLALLSSCSGGSVGQQLSHFSVGYRRATAPPDPGRWVQVVSIEAVGRDVLRLLEKQYSTLANTLDHAMSRTIPVIILEDAEYRITTGAPAWAGGQFDSDDGTITIPVNVFQRIVFEDPELERWWGANRELWIETALMHETAHAFIDEITQGAAPRAFNEGLAKYLEREVTKERQDLTSTLQLELQERYGQEQAAALLARAVEEFRTEDLGRSSTVFTTYVGGELFVEYLVKQRGMGGVRSVLDGIASTRSVDAAFDAAYGRSYDGTRRAWLDWLRGQWGVSGPRR
jgi:tetratricopeptide (TPR) repeat protein